jgi:hypothetical protein
MEMALYSLEIVKHLLSMNPEDTINPKKLFELLQYEENEMAEFLLALKQLNKDSQPIAQKPNKMMTWSGLDITPIRANKLAKTTRQRLEAALVITGWLLDREYTDRVNEMGNRPFHECFEWLISRGKDFQWFQNKRGSDGGIDSYAEFRDKNDKINAWVVQAKTNPVTMPVVRNLLGTYTLLKQSPTFTRKWADGFESSFNYHSCVLILMTSKPVPPKVRKEFLDQTKDFQAIIKFHLLDPWDIAWIIVTSADTFANRSWKEEDLPKLLSMINKLAEDDKIFV